MKSSINKTTRLLIEYVSLQELVEITPSWRHRSRLVPFDGYSSESELISPSEQSVSRSAS